ncbi:MAG TPA: hypothetical protein VLV78_11995 [Thermoanaerobaculia bacterium]|nr:hypothetical protein [Thermoanaerobaculia bacterium]
MRTVALLLAVALSIGPAEAASRRRIVGRGGSDSPFGVVINNSAVAASQSVRALDLAHNAGIQWAHIEFTWSRIQPSAGQADYSAYTQIVARAADSGIRLVGRLGYATPWNTTAPASVTNATQREHYPPADYDAWSRYIFTTVTLFKSSIHHWEIWNEPDLGPTTPDGPCSGFWCGTAAQYARLLSVASDAVKRADPNAVVLFGGLALTSSADPNFVFNVLTDPDNPGGDSFDVMAIHVTGSRTDAIRQMNFTKSQLAFGGAGLRPIWVTAVGYPSDPAAQKIAPYFDGEAGQAAYAREIPTYLVSLGARKVFWLQLFDSGSDQFASYGLLTSLLATKKAYDAYSDTIRAYHP